MLQINEDAGMDGTRVWPNTGGERVVEKRKKKRNAVATGEVVPRRLLIKGAVTVALGCEISVALRSFFAPSPDSGADSTVDNVMNDIPFMSFKDGDAVTAPTLETSLEDIAALPSFPEQQSTIDQLVRILESRQGAQYFAASAPGKWVLPWVGGWQRICTSETDASFLGGPPKDVFRFSGAERLSMSKAGSVDFRQESARTFVYGPGQGGATIEYLFSAPGVATKLLVTRNGTVTNLGGNFFSIEYAQPPEAYPVEQVRDEDLLESNVPLPLDRDMLGPRSAEVQLRTTYLSATMWIVRDALDKFVVFQRTETRSVMDRRGLVADGQLKPSNDETIRYGRLLFGESASDYTGWEENQNADKSGTDRLLRQ
eukprot:CAMPEP_0119312874 /NCGR_PEP_ID=MMETSP1333-20130426/27063_1 /TAXON_ID=418940 /ORGANISM="Scyphosphaera apsteinii, Strain RCC1455" /LENGTH=369 /DNA_ID=CAMNT_0007317555 /DNA_START=64 /DNA_END=1173 /DNA_ORIENTATION=-